MENETTETTTSSSVNKKMDMKWLVAAIAAVILIGGGFFFLNQNKTATNSSVTPAPTSTQEAAPTEEAQTTPEDAMEAEGKTISLSSHGFSPASLTIKVGEKVTWTNEDNGPSTVNSDPHPAHTNYPPLNLGKFNDGEELSLTFDKPGTYGYHNHLNPSQKGTIIVQ